MAIKKFTMKDVDEEIVQIIEQAQGGTSQPPKLLQTLLEKAKAKRAGK